MSSADKQNQSQSRWETAATAPILILLVYASWLLLTMFANSIHWAVLIFLGGFVVCLHGSLQHESIHFRICPNARLNRVLLGIPLNLCISYDVYRRTHIAHHQCDALTDPVNDPESFYWNEKDWSRLTVMLRYLYRFNQTLSGRMLVGPWLFVIQFLWGELSRILSGDRLAWREWSFHALLLTPVIFWIVVVAQVPLWKYVICFSWPGLSLTLLRSFAEHRPARLQEERSVVVEGSWFTRLLFLGNNYHALHHARADIPWYRMRAEFLVGRKALLDQNRNYYFRSYLELFKRYAFRAKDDPVVQS